MSDNGSLFIGSDETVGEVAGWLGAALGTEVLSWSPVEVGLRARAVSVDDGWVGFLVRANGYIEADPAPEDVQALDGYPVEVDVQYLGKDEEVLRAEAKAAFERVVAARPDLPVLLCHNLALLVAAYLPGAGIKYFEAGTTPDGPDLAVWEPWVVR
ncbi:hypothetical protein [Kribbella sp. NPDC051770]|uniref:hypothetical protein n=1 Tax=Kribbella sp. NPDC051770 TaxID=3155413 RepID=UPI0034322426